MHGCRDLDRGGVAFCDQLVEPPPGVLVLGLRQVSPLLREALLELAERASRHRHTAGRLGLLLLERLEPFLALVQTGPEALELLLEGGNIRHEPLRFRRTHGLRLSSPYLVQRNRP